jgi:hypothetical protein
MPRLSSRPMRFNPPASCADWPGAVDFLPWEGPHFGCGDGPPADGRHGAGGRGTDGSWLTPDQKVWLIKDTPLAATLGEGIGLPRVALIGRAVFSQGQAIGEFFGFRANTRTIGASVIPIWSQIFRARRTLTRNASGGVPIILDWLADHSPFTGLPQAFKDSMQACDCMP